MCKCEEYPCGLQPHRYSAAFPKSRRRVKKSIKFRINQNGLSVSVAKPTGIKLSVRGTRGIQEALVQTGSVCGVKHIDLTVKSAV